MASEKLSNVIGAPFQEYILTQLNLRATHNSTGNNAVPTRTNDEVLFLANKSAWVKLTSSVRIELKEGDVLKYYERLGVGTNYTNPRDLAKAWILEAGTSKAVGTGIDLRYGIGPDGAYGLGGTEELGYRPMPGLTSVSIDSKGTLGSLREANISFKVWNMNQLNAIEALYFRLGYSMLLEWGHTQFYNNPNINGIPGGTFVTSTYGIDPFVDNMRKEEVQQKISKRSYGLSGNYDGMLGIVTNFNWSFNQEGGYDCTVKLMGLGAIMDSLRINQSYKMPSILFEKYKQQQAVLKDIAEKAAIRAAEDQAAKVQSDQKLPPLPAVPKNPSEIYKNIFVADDGNPNPPENEATFLQKHSYYTAYETNLNGVNNVYDYYYKAVKGGAYANPAFRDQLNEIRTGLFLNPITNIRSTWQVIYADKPQPVTLSSVELNSAALFAIDPNNEYPRPTNAARLAFGGAYDQNDLAKSIGLSNFTSLFDLIIRDSKGTANKLEVARVIDAIQEEGLTVDPEEYLYPIEGTVVFGIDLTKTVGVQLKLQYAVPVRLKNGAVGKQVFEVVITYNAPPLEGGATIGELQDSANKKAKEDKKKRPTRRELTQALENWLSRSRKINITEITTLAPNIQGATGLSKQRFSKQNTETSERVLVKGTLANVTIPGKPDPQLTIEFTNTALIQTVLPYDVPRVDPSTTAALSGSTGDANGTENSAASQQTDSAARFESALHAMLSAVKSQIQYQGAISNDTVFPVNLSELTSTMYEQGILKGITVASSKAELERIVKSFELLPYARKGFNSNLMSNPDVYSAVPNVKFDKLCIGYGIKYVVQEDETKVNYPTYIKFGYLLAFLNSMCLIYDSTVDADKHPYVYLDFNPETNFCLSVPQHMSIDPFTCMIPYEGSDVDYLNIFPPELRIPLDSNPNIFSTKINGVSSYFENFKNKNYYQGKTMEILLNIDFLLDVLKQYTTADPAHVVNLKGFLDSIVTGINKSTGNLNLFRVSYRDDSNTVIIKDDQFVPPYDGEAWMLDSTPNNKDSKTYSIPDGFQVPKYGQLPVFGAQSLVREMQFQTNLSTAMSNQLAISAQAQTGSVNATDYSPFSYLNANYVDAYKRNISDSANPVATKEQQLLNASEEEKKGAVVAAQDLNNALQFNTHVRSVYYDGNLSRKAVSNATNYLITGMAKVKATDKITSAAPFIPANLSLTIDGIGGIIMGNAFTIPEDRLPASLRGNGSETKVGFVVVGLTHTIDKNQWLTKIRGQMIKLRDSTKYNAPIVNLSKIQTQFQQQPLEGAEAVAGAVITNTGCTTSYKDLPIVPTVQTEFIKKTEAAVYLKTKYPDIGLAVYAVLTAEAGSSGDSFRSAGGNNFGGVQTDSGRWGFGNFTGQFCRRDSGGVLRMFAIFPTPYAFLDFLVNRIKAKGFTNSPDQWTATYIAKWWSPAEKAQYTKGSTTYNQKLAIFNSAASRYNQA
jgi:hypothetical protein